MHLKYGRSAGNDVYPWNGTTSRATVASRTKVSFEQMAALIPEIMDGSFYTFKVNIRKTYFMK
jgi:hypothetical protein